MRFWTDHDRSLSEAARQKNLHEVVMVEPGRFRYRSVVTLPFVPVVVRKSALWKSSRQSARSLVPEARNGVVSGSTHRTTCCIPTESVRFFLLETKMELR